MYKLCDVNKFVLIIFATICIMKMYCYSLFMFKFRLLEMFRTLY